MSSPEDDNQSVENEEKDEFQESKYAENLMKELIKNLYQITKIINIFKIK